MLPWRATAALLTAVVTSRDAVTVMAASAQRLAAEYARSDRRVRRSGGLA